MQTSRVRIYATLVEYCIFLILKQSKPQDKNIWKTVNTCYLIGYDYHLKQSENTTSLTPQVRLPIYSKRRLPNALSLSE